MQDGRGWWGGDKLQPEEASGLAAPASSTSHFLLETKHQKMSRSLV